MATVTPEAVELTPARARPLELFLCYSKVIVIAALCAVLYGRVAVGLVRDWWTEPSLSYGLLIPPLAFYLAWLKRSLVFAAPVKPDPAGLALAGTACLLFLLGNLGAEFFLQRISMIVLLAAFILAFWGRGRLRCLAFPLVLLAAMVPLPAVVYNSLASPLQLLASDIAAELARLCGVAVYRDGNILELANVSLGVEEACSGLNSLSSLVIGSLLVGNLLLRRLRSKVALFLLAAPIAVAVNVIRVTGTAILADYRAEFAMGFYHLFSGWMVFLLGVAAIFGTARLLVPLLDKRSSQ